VGSADILSERFESEVAIICEAGRSGAVGGIEA
jgi:hypothetical protein